MKRLSVGLLGAVMGLAVLVAPVSTASAQALSISIFVGGVFPTGELGDEVNTGWLVGGNVDYRFSEGRSPVSLRLDLAYGSSSVKDFGTPVDLKFNNIYAIGYALLHPNIGQGGDKATMDLYVGGGGGFVQSSVGGSDAEALKAALGDDLKKTNKALSGVVGGAAPIGGVSLFFEGRWVLIFPEGGGSESLFPVVAGVRIPLGGN